MNGLLALNKPAGPTSHDIVARVRRSLGLRKVGHSGTLDPPATGLLLVAVGRATRLIRFLPHSPKEYRGRMRLGATSDTDDAAGTILMRREATPPTAAEVVRAADDVRRRGRQRPPRVSARKVGGKRLHALARAGVDVDAPETEVEVSRLDLVPTDDPWTWEFRATVSAGTYIRSLARDLGEALGCGGLLETLERTRIGPIELGSALAAPAHPPTEEDRDRLLAGLVPPEALPLAVGTCHVEDDDLARRFCSGGAIPGPRDPEGPLRVVHPRRGLLGVGEGRSGLVHPRVVL